MKKKKKQIRYQRLFTMCSCYLCKIKELAEKYNLKLAGETEREKALKK